MKRTYLRAVTLIGTALLVVGIIWGALSYNSASNDRDAAQSICDFAGEVICQTPSVEPATGALIVGAVGIVLLAGAAIARRATPDG